MTTSQKQTLAIELVGFEFFKTCIKNGATDKEAKAEMIRPENMQIMSERVNEILN